MSAIAELTTVVLDCADPSALAGFYRAVSGWTLEHSDADTAYLSNGGPIQLGFQRVDGYLPPAWPGLSKQAHLDFKVADLAVGVKEALAAGASQPDFQPGGDEWIVLLYPEGHPFCLVG